MFPWHKDKNETWGQNNNDNSKQIKFTSHMNFKNTYKTVTIISEWLMTLDSFLDA